MNVHEAIVELARGKCVGYAPMMDSYDGGSYLKLAGNNQLMKLLPRSSCAAEVRWICDFDEFQTFRSYDYVDFFIVKP